jgi:hypothetical protein
MSKNTKLHTIKINNSSIGSCALSNKNKSRTKTKEESNKNKGRVEQKQRVEQNRTYFFRSPCTLILTDTEKRSEHWGRFNESVFGRYLQVKLFENNFKKLQHLGGIVPRAPLRTTGPSRQGRYKTYLMVCYVSFVTSDLIIVYLADR